MKWNRLSPGCRTLLVTCTLVLVLGVSASADPYDFVGWSVPIATVRLPLNTLPQPYVISFYGRTYTPGSTPGDPGSSIWYYYVESPAAQAISHWVLELCLPTHVVVDVNENTTATSSLYELGEDKFTGITGIKWDEGFDGTLAKQQSVTLEGNWEVGLVDVGVKPGGDAYVGQILGPTCTPPTELEIEVGGLAALEIDQPLIGDWVSSGGMSVASLGSLSVSVTASASVSYTLLVSYGIGATSSPLNPVFDGLPLSFEYPTGSGSWTEILAGPSGVTLPGLTSGTASHAYPIRVNLDQLGDRKAGEVIEFELTVTVTAD